MTELPTSVKKEIVEGEKRKELLAKLSKKDAVKAGDRLKLLATQISGRRTGS